MIFSGVEVEAYSLHVLVFCDACVSAGSWTLTCGRNVGWQQQKQEQGL